MRIILLYPPQWIPMNPHFSVASLLGQLREHGYDTQIRDINVEFYNHVLSKSYIANSINKAFSMKDKLFEELKLEYSDDKSNESYPEEFRKKLVKYQKIKQFEEKRMDEIANILEGIENTVAIMRDKERFYTPEELIKAFTDIDSALEMISLPYHPTSLEFFNYSDPFFKLTMESIKEKCLNKSDNIFYDFYELILPSILLERPDFVGISINSSSQIVGGLTLARMLKQTGKTHVSIGGNFFGRVVETLQKHPEFFELFADSLIVEEGEKPIVELARHLEGKISIDQVPNLVYPDNGIIKANEKTKPLKLNEMHIQDLDGFPLNLYFTPDIVLSIQASRGCYWQKCSFCDHFFGQNVNSKDLDILVNEMKQVQEKYGISHFEFIDESVSPAYLRQMSTRILDEGMNVSWFNNARLEDEFNSELLQLASKAGLKMALWGVESGSMRIMELINKGINLDKRMDILRDAVNAGIWNFAFIFFGFPTETREEAMQTIEMICKNTDVILSYGRSVFTLGKHTRLQDDPEKYCITEIKANEEEFSPSYTFKTSQGMNDREINEIAQLCTQECNKAYGNPLWMYLRYREVIFLYVSKYGTQEVHNCKVC